MKFSEVYAELGEFGPYQQRIFWLICSLSIPLAFHFMGNVFLLAVPEHRCAIPELDNDTYESQGEWHDELINRSIPWQSEKKMYSQCELFVKDVTQSDWTNETRKCHKWVYSQETFHSTFVTEVNLVCDALMYKTYINMATMAGIFAGSLVLGSLSDVIGRRKVFIISVIGYFGVSMVNGFIYSYSVFVALKFLTTFFGIGYYLCTYVLATEIVGPSKRKHVATVLTLFWCGGQLILTGASYVIRDWNYLQITISCPVALVSMYIFILPESPRWLFNKGKLEETSEILHRIAKSNHVTLSNKISLKDVAGDDVAEGGKIWQMMIEPMLFIRCMVIFVNWAVASMIYYGLTLNAGNMSGNIFLNFSLMTAMEVVANIVCLILLDTAGRRLLQSTSMILAGVACICTLFPAIYGDADDNWITLVLSLVGKFGASAGFTVIYIYTAELFPTVMRNSGIGFSSVMARIGSVLAPYIADIGNVIQGDMAVALPLLIFGGTSIVAGLLALLLPETVNKMLPETVEDAKNLGRKSKARNQLDLTVIPSVTENTLTDGKWNPSFSL